MGFSLVVLSYHELSPWVVPLGITDVDCLIGV